MPLHNALTEAWECADTLPQSFDWLVDHLDPQWVEEALSLTGQATIRRRRLPSDHVLWLVVGMALFRGEPVQEVARRLNIIADGLASEALLAKSGVSKARQRLGDEPLQHLFSQSAKTWGQERLPADDWQGLQVFAIDGALFRTPETPELREHFGSGNTSTERQTPHPMLRLVALMNVRSHVVMQAAISPYRRGEIRLAEPFLRTLPDHSITLLDKGFWGADLLLSLQASGQHRHWLIPERKGLVYECLEEYGPGDCLLEMRVSPQARKRNPALPESWQVRAVTYEINGKEKTVFTSLPHRHYHAQDIAQLYHERWQIELGFRDIKTSMLNNAIVLRSKKVSLIYQELWGVLLAYNIVRREASHAAIEHRANAQDVSFKFAFQFIAAQLVVMAGACSQGKTASRLKDLRSGLAALFITRRSRPSRPRSVKISKTRYPVNRNAAPLK